jgi:thioredoxin 1
MRRCFAVAFILSLPLLITGCGKASAPKPITSPASNAIQLSEATFQTEIANQSGVALVDFWAPWCGPCKVIAPAIEELATELKPTVKVGKVDVDTNPNLANSFEISSIPCLILFKDGKEVDRKLGVLSKDDLKTWIDKAVKTQEVPD